MANEKVVSVCINAYNAHSTIKETVESVLSQTYTNLQVIVVDDCSTDDTAEIVRSIPDGRVELYSLAKNGNISNANNEAISHARGEYIAHLDSDDVWLPEKIEKQVAFLEENPQYGACFTHVVSVDETGTVTGVDNGRFETIFNKPVMTQPQVVRYFYDSSNMICHSTMLIRKSVQDELGLHDLSMQYLHDFDMWARLIIRYPLYIMQEPLIKYRVRAGSNSEMDELKTIAHNEEYARVIYNMIVNCPDELFIQSFSDKFRLQGEHTHDELELEKAFVLLDGFRPLRGNYALGLRRFDELFADKKFVTLAEEKFGFGVRDLYELHRHEIYHDADRFESLREAVRQSEQLIGENARLSEDNRVLISQKGELEAQKATLEQSYQQLQQQYALIERSLPMRLTKPVRKFKTFKRTLADLQTRNFADGTPAKTRVMLFGFFGHNLGDDMFFDMLLRRYPDTLFCVEHTPDYAAFFSRYKNVKFYDVSAPHVMKIINLGKKLGYANMFDEKIYRACDAAIHIGGSVYQQIADWESDLEIRKKRHSFFDNFFCVSNNFGPFFTEEYKKFWIDEFTKFNDVCFRDVYSYGLFMGLTNVRYAPDLLFSYRDESKTISEKRVAISVINPRFRVRQFSEQQAQGYENKLVELINYYVAKGYRISLLGFCELEEDRQEIEKILGMLDSNVASAVSCKYFTDDYTVITEEIKRSEIVIATRFHAMILGYVLGRKVLPICYSDKMKNVVEDLKLTGSYVLMENIVDFTAVQLDAMANRVDAGRIAQLHSLADGQFHGFDRYVESRGGQVVK